MHLKLYYYIYATKHTVISWFGFIIIDEREEPNIMGNGFITYQSNATLIRIVIDRSQVLLNVGEVNAPEREWLEFSDVIHYFKPEFGEVYDFSNEASIEKQAKRVSELLRKYCEPILIGDFSIKDLI